MDVEFFSYPSYSLGKEPATEELRVLLVQHVLYIRTGLNFFSNKKKNSRNNFSVYMKLILCFESFVIIFC